MYSINMPKIKETLSLGNDIIGLKIIDISTTDSENHTRQQKEARIQINPLCLEYSHHYKDSLVFGVSIFKKSISIRIKYGKSERI
jgi:hypothetical protein